MTPTIQMELHDIHPTPVNILFRKDIEKLHQFDNIDTGHYLNAYVSFKIHGDEYYITRSKFKFNIASITSITNRSGLDLDELMTWFNELNINEIKYFGFKEPQYLISYKEHLVGLDFYRQF
jgi:hypothetical protein